MKTSQRTILHEPTRETRIYLKLVRLMGTTFYEHINRGDILSPPAHNRQIIYDEIYENEEKYL